MHATRAALHKVPKCLHTAAHQTQTHIAMHADRAATQKVPKCLHTAAHLTQPHVAMHATRAALHKVPKCRHTVAHQTQTKLNLFPFCTSQQSIGLVYSPTLQKDERALRAYLQGRKYSVHPCNNKRSVTQ